MSMLECIEDAISACGFQKFHTYGGKTLHTWLQVSPRWGDKLTSVGYQCIV